MMIHSIYKDTEQLIEMLIDKAAEAEVYRQKAAHNENDAAQILYASRKGMAEEILEQILVNVEDRKRVKRAIAKKVKSKGG